MVNNTSRVGGGTDRFNFKTNSASQTGASGRAGKASATSQSSGAAQSGDILKLSASSTAATPNVSMFEGEIQNTQAVAPLKNTVTQLSSDQRAELTYKQLASYLVEQFV